MPRGNAMRTLLTLSVCFFPSLAGAADSETTPLPRAHAHNDYAHTRPLLDALRHGFTSVEADVFLVDGKLLVAHTRVELAFRKRTLEELYLDPLLKLVRKNKGRVYPEGAGFTLLVDFKNEGEATWLVLQRVLENYAEMLTVVRGGKVEKNAVTVIISGDRPESAIADSKVRFAGIDGRLSDLDSTSPAHLLPLISDRWTKHYKWRGDGEMPAVERRKLRDIVTRAHAKGRRVRFWATPENEALWKELNDAGVDHINTDQLARLKKFLLDSRAEKKPDGEKSKS